MSAEDIAHSLRPEEASSRTIRRDMETLRDVGAPVRIVGRGKATRYAILADGPTARLDSSALLALELAWGFLKPYRDTALGDAIEHIRMQASARLPAAALEHFSELLSATSVTNNLSSRLGPKEPVFAVIRNAILARSRVDIDYTDSTRKKTRRRVHPKQLVHGPRGLYLLALDESRDMEVRTFRIERIDAATATKLPIDPDNPAELEDWREGSIGIFSSEFETTEFTIRITDETTRLLLTENPLHDSQRLDSDHDGGWILRLRLSTTRELIPHVLAMGAGAEALTPTWFREEVSAAVRRAAARYPESPRKKSSSAASRSRPVQDTG